METTNCRILTPNDARIIPIYFDIVRTGLDGLKDKYISPKEVDNAIKKYSQQYLLNHLRPNNECRLIGAFEEDSLEGSLLESFREQEGYNITRINWIFAKTPGKGIGTSLLRDCKSRAKREGKDMVELAVSELNEDAKRLYLREEFTSLPGFPLDEGIRTMFYLLNPELKSYYGIK